MSNNATSTVYRVQHITDGRGPWRPGFPQVWSNHNPIPPAWFVDLASLTLDVGWYYGSAVRNVDDLALWFDAVELARLFVLGYHVVALDGCEIVAESTSQVVFRRRVPHVRGATPVAIAPMVQAR